MSVRPLTVTAPPLSPISGAIAVGETESSSSSVGVSVVPPVTKACCRLAKTGVSAVAALVAGKTVPATSTVTLASAVLPATKLRSCERRRAVPVSGSVPPPVGVSSAAGRSLTGCAGRSVYGTVDGAAAACLDRRGRAESSVERSSVSVGSIQVLRLGPADSSACRRRLKRRLRGRRTRRRRNRCSGARCRRRRGSV